MNTTATDIARSYGLEDSTLLYLSKEIRTSVLFDEVVDKRLSIISRNLIQNLIFTIVHNMKKGRYDFVLYYGYLSITMEMMDFNQLKILHVDLANKCIH